jgi:succinate dehydrogenase hydrophobic anchor subunit
MAVLQFEHTVRATAPKKDHSILRGWLQRVGAVIMLPVVLGLIMFRPEWFEPDE